MLNTLNRITQSNKDNGIVDVTVSADSINEVGDRITTFLLHRFPKILQAELNTHRNQISRNSASARAINRKKFIESIKSDTYIPVWTVDQKGMSGEAVTEQSYLDYLNESYLHKMYSDIAYVEAKYDGIHKQNINPMLEQYSRIPIIITSTNWEYFFSLRCAADVNPEFRRISLIMQDLYKNSIPQLTEYHLPLILPAELEYCIEDKLILSAARSAWISYANHNKEYSIEIARNTVSKLVADKHGSPLDHPAQAAPYKIGGLYPGWQEYRQIVLGK